MAEQAQTKGGLASTLLKRTDQPSKVTDIDKAKKRRQSGPKPTKSAPPQPTVSTERKSTKFSVSCLEIERDTVEDRGIHFKKVHKRRDLKPSRLVRIALKLLEQTTDEEVLRLADEVENLEVRRTKHFAEPPKG